MKNLWQISMIQGAYYLLTGLWGLLHIESFMSVTGPKTDIWLVKMVSVLVIIIGGVMTMAGFNKNISREIIALALGSAIGFCLIEIYYVGINRISAIYLLDALVQLLLVSIWTVFVIRQRSKFKAS